MGRMKYEPLSKRDVDEDEEDDADTSMLDSGGHGDCSYSPSSLAHTHNKHYDYSHARSEAAFDLNRGGGNGSHLISKRSFMETAMKTGSMILLYFTLSIGLTFYQSSLLKNFKFPLTVVLYHLIIKYLLAGMFRIIYYLVTGRRRVNIDCQAALKIAPIGFASGIDIGFSNWGLELVQISLYTMTKSTSIVFILIFSILLKLEKRSWSLACIVVLISGGLVMFTYKASNFDAMGFIFILIASLSSGIRWSFAQLLMQRSKMGLHNPIDMIYHMQPWMILSILPVVIIFEQEKIATNWHVLVESSFDVIFLMVMKISIGAILAFGMELSEFLVLSNTSSLTLSVSGVVKEILQLVLAVETNHDRLSFINLIGLVLCLAGICCHVLNKYYVYTRAMDQRKIMMMGGDAADNAYLSNVKLEGRGLFSSGGGGGGGTNTGTSTKNGTTGAHHHHKHQKHQGSMPLLVGSALIDSDDDDVEVFNARTKSIEQSSNDILADIVQRRDQRR